MSFGFYPRKNDACPDVGHCPHAGGAAIATLVQLSNDNEQFHRYLHGTIDAERERNSRLFQENEKLKAELEQVKLELKLERQSKFATNKQKQAEAEASIPPPHITIGRSMFLRRADALSAGARLMSLIRRIQPNTCKKTSSTASIESCCTKR